MLQSQFLTTTLVGLSLLTSLAQAAPTGERVEAMLHSPGARALMDEEVDLWQRNLEVKRISIRDDVVVTGNIVLRGLPSDAQRFNRGKLVRCNVRLIGGGHFAALREACDMAHPIYLPLSQPGKDQPTSVAPGFYILGFENSVYPGFLEVKAGQTSAINLTQIPVPDNGAVKIYRDMNSLTEEFKLYFSTYVLGESVFKLAEYSFGDLYIKSFGVRDGVVPLSYKTCEGTKLPEMTAKGARICKAWNMGTFMTLTELFNFNADGSFLQWEVGDQGKPYPYPSARLLVAQQTNSTRAKFVNVLPGQYVVEVTDANGAVKATSTGPIGVDPVNTLAMNIGWVPAAAKLAMNGAASSVKMPSAVDPAADQSTPSAAALAAADPDGNAGEVVNVHQTCSSARMWRTDLRSYCTSDSAPGCARSRAKICEPMFDIP